MAKSFYLYIDCTNPEARKFTRHLIKNCKAFSVPEHLTKPYNYFIATIDKENRLIFRGWLKHPEQYRIIDGYGNEECKIQNFANRLVDLCFAHSNAFKSLNEQRGFRCIKDSSIIHLIDYIRNYDLNPSKIVYEKLINNTYINEIYKENLVKNNNMKQSFYINIPIQSLEDIQYVKEILKKYNIFTVSQKDIIKNYLVAYINPLGRLVITTWEISPLEYDHVKNISCMIHCSKEQFEDTLIKNCIAYANNLSDCIKVDDSVIIELCKILDKSNSDENLKNNLLNNDYVYNILIKNIPNYETQLQRKTNSQSIGEHADQSRISCRRAKTQLCCYDVKPQEIHRNKKERNYRGLH